MLAARSRRATLRYVPAVALVAIGLTMSGSAGSLAASPVAAAATRPPALIQAGDSKTTCIDFPLRSYDLPASLGAVEHQTGVHFDCIVTYSDADVTWGAWVSPWITGRQYGYVQWLAADRARRSIVVTQNLVPDVVDHQAGWAATCATGAFRTYGRQLASSLIHAGFGYAVVRLGPEMNGNWYYDSLGATRASWREWAECFAQTVTAMRSVRGGHFLFDWNVNAGLRPIPLAAYYPGNRYVDIVGIDAYDTAPSNDLPPVGSPARWPRIANEPYGLEAVYRFAAAHHKPLSLPEWGTVSGANGGDDPSYVTHMAAFIASHDVSYQAWFDTPSPGVLPLDPSVAPRSVAAYAAAFGPGSAIAAYQQRVDR